MIATQCRIVHALHGELGAIVHVVCCQTGTGAQGIIIITMLRFVQLHKEIHEGQLVLVVHRIVKLGEKARPFLMVEIVSTALPGRDRYWDRQAAGSSGT